MAKTTTIKKDIIPYRAGVVLLTPLDENKQPDYTKTVATGYDFLTSTQTSVSRSTETLDNGNGQDKEYVNDETYTVTVTGNTFNPVFHGVVTGRIETLPDKHLMPVEVNLNLTEKVDDGNDYEITFGAGEQVEREPAADASGNYQFYVEDSHGNVLVRNDSATTLENGMFKWDKTTKALKFADTYKGAAIRVIYRVEDTNVWSFESSPVIRQPEYQVEIMGLSQSASTGDIYRVVTTIKRATATGDVTDQTTQKSKSAPITYTFSSTPVPEGVSVYRQDLSIYQSATSSTDSNDNVVNGGDDKFTANE